MSSPAFFTTELVPVLVFEILIVSLAPGVCGIVTLLLPSGVLPALSLILICMSSPTDVLSFKSKLRDTVTV